MRRRAGAVTYVDKVFGEVTTPNIAQQDFVLMRSDGVPLYNFGAVVDDITMGITLVARGRDHMINTPPQILLYEALGAKPPQFAHLPMMLAPNGEKLSKRHGAVSVGEYRDAGLSRRRRVLNYLARFGWSHGDQEIFSLRRAHPGVRLGSVRQGDGKFDAKKFAAIDHEHLKTRRLSRRSTSTPSGVLPFLAEARHRPTSTKARSSTRASPPFASAPRTFVEAADDARLLLPRPPVMDEKAKKKFLVPEGRRARLARLRATRSRTADEWTEAALEAATSTPGSPQAGLEMKDVAQPARVALTGRTASPGLFQVLVVLGQRALARAPHARGSSSPRATALTLRSIRDLALRPLAAPSCPRAELDRARTLHRRRSYKPLLPIPLHRRVLAPVVWLLLPRHVARARRRGARAPARRRCSRSGKIRSAPPVLFVIVALILTLQEYYGGRDYYDQTDPPVAARIKTTRHPHARIKLAKYDEL